MSEKSVDYYKKGAIVSYITIAVNIIASLLYTPWMLSKIGDGDYGLYTLASSLINMFLIDFGFGSAVTRFISKYNAEGDQEKIDNFMGMLYKLYGIIVGVVFLILVVLFFFLGDIYIKLTPEELEKFKVVYLIAGSYTVLSFPFTSTFSGILTSYEKYYQMKLCDLIHKILTVGLIIVALSFGLGLYTLVAINAFAGLITLVIKGIIIGRQTKLKPNLSFFDRSVLKEIFSFSIWVTVSALCSRLIFNITPSILGITVGAAAITIFNLASTIEGYTYTFASAVDGMFMPKIARLVKEDPSCHNVEPLLNKVGRIQFFVVALIFLGFAAVGQEFIYLWLGEGYEVVYYCALFLIAPAPFYLSQQIAKNTVVVTGHVKEQAFVNIFKAVFNIVLVAVFSYFWGVLGAAISICIAYFVRNIGLNIIYQKIIGLNMWKFHFECYVKPLPALFLTVAISVGFNILLPDYAWWTLIIKVMGICFAYAGSLWLLGLNAYEKNLVVDTVKKLFKRKDKESVQVLAESFESVKEENNQADKE